MCDDLCKYCIDIRDTPRTIVAYMRCEECYKERLKYEIDNEDTLDLKYNFYRKHMKSYQDLQNAKREYNREEKFYEQLEIEQKEEAKLKEKKELSKNFKGWSFITLGPTPFFDFTDESKAKLVEWCNEWITEHNYSAASWVIESGKNKKNPNLHVHFFCRIKNPKHHKRDLIHNWEKKFPNNKLIGNNYHIVKCNTEKMFYEKQEYMIDNSKGTHQNFIDLQLRGGFGGLGVISSQ